MSEIRYSVDELKNLYGVTERTLKNWKKYKDFPMLEISSQHKYVYKDDLVKWEKSFLQLIYLNYHSEGCS